MRHLRPTKTLPKPDLQQLFSLNRLKGLCAALSNINGKMRCKTQFTSVTRVKSKEEF